MLSIASAMGAPTVPGIVAPTGRRRERTVELAQASAPRALSRRCVMVLVSEKFGSPPARIRFLIARQSRDGSCAFSSAATPVTWGVAIEVPLNTE